MSSPAENSWAERVADRSPSVQRSRTRSMQQAQQIVDAARRLIAEQADQFTTQELAKEAGVAVQTFYRYFSGKDHLLLAVFEDMMNEAAIDFARAAQDLPDPLSRLHSYVTTAFASIGSGDLVAAKFTTTQHWRLHQLFPEEMTDATQPITDLIAAELRQAYEQGLVSSADIEHDAANIARLVMVTYHYYAFAPLDDPTNEISEQVWSFCLRAITNPASS